ncbi:MAG: hypothetical protein LC650_04995, partial [Actinobacteria bacterium]|nr:hypothetical protein [Actinomycetota bacterium]
MTQILAHIHGFWCRFPADSIPVPSGTGSNLPSDASEGVLERVPDGTEILVPVHDPRPTCHSQRKSAKRAQTLSSSRLVSALCSKQKKEGIPCYPPTTCTVTSLCDSTGSRVSSFCET